MSAGGAPTVEPHARLLNWKALLGITISLAALYFTFRSMELGDVLGQLRRADPLLLLLSAAATLGVFWIRAWRWRAILKPVRLVSFRTRFAAVTIGFMGNNLLPARIGEFMRVYTLSRAEPVPIVSSFASLIIERLFDGVMVISLLFAAMALPDFPEFSGRQSFNIPGFEQSFTIAGLARGAGIFVVAAIVVLLALVLFPRRAVALLERVVMVLPRGMRRPIVDALEAFLSGVGVVRNPALLTQTLAWSIVLWVYNAVGCWIAFRAFGLQLPFSAAIFLQSFIALAVSIPSAPGFFGIYHGAAVFVLGHLFGAQTATAGAFAVGFHLAGFIPVTLIGLYYAWRMGLSLREVARSEDVVEEAVEVVVDEQGGPEVVREERRTREERRRNRRNP